MAGERRLQRKAPDALRLQGIAQNRISLSFVYWRLRRSGEELIARGEQEIASMRHSNGSLTPVPLPATLRDALRSYS